jgi:hypothetical protein
MGDLWVGLAILTLVSAATFRLVSAVAVTLAPRVRLICTAVVVALLATFLVFWQSPRMATLFPVSNLIVVSNWLPILASAVAALLWTDKETTLWRRHALAATALVLGGWTAINPLMGSTPHCTDRRGPYGDSQQSTEFTCSAASAATFLRAHGIEATEQEMADLCLTRRGTSWMGIYRGLKLKTEGTPWKVELISDRSLAMESVGRRPILANMGLTRTQALIGNSVVDRQENGWIPGVDHTVVLLGRGPADTFQVADPTPGIDREIWRPEMFNALWRGVGFQLVQRETPGIAVVAKSFE